MATKQKDKPIRKTVKWQPTKLSDGEVIQMLATTCRWNRARRVFSDIIGQFEQQDAQNNLNPMELRRREFEVVERLARALDVDSALKDFH